MTYRFVLKGQCPSGKNAMQVTRDGRHYPNERFKLWREDASWQLKQQLKKMDFETITEPCSIIINYISSDKRRRDVPGIIDALWHLLEKMNIVADDTLLGGLGCSVTFKHGGYDKSSPMVELIIADSSSR